MRDKHKVLLVDCKRVGAETDEVIMQYDETSEKKYVAQINSLICERFGTKSRENFVAKKYCSNYGLLMLSTLLKENFFDVDYVNADYFHNNDEFVDEVLKKTADCFCVCFTATTPQFPEVCRLSKKIKEISPNIRTIVGGPHVSGFPDDNKLLENTQFDAFVKGPDLRKTVDIIKNGIAKEHCIYVAWEYFDCDKDFGLIPAEYLNDTYLYSYISYGCNNGCKYCVEHKLSKGIEYLDIDAKIKEIRYLAEHCNVKYLHLCDSDFFANTDHVERFLSLLRAEKIKVCFSCNTTPWAITEPKVKECIKNFIDLGLIEIMVGVEHCSHHVTRKLCKPYDFERLKDSLIEIKKDYKIPFITLYSMVGLPFENKEEIKLNIKRFKELKSCGAYDYSFPKMFVPYPATEIFKHPEKHNASIKTYNWSFYQRGYLPRPITFDGMSDDDFIYEIEALNKLND